MSMQTLSTRNKKAEKKNLCVMLYVLIVQHSIIRVHVLTINN